MILAAMPSHPAVRNLLAAARDRGLRACWGHERAPVDARRYELRDGVAVVPVSGLLGTDLVSLYLGTHTLALAAALRHAAADPEVRAVVLDIDSPGGQVSMLSDVTAAARAAREAKPLLAYAHGSCCSAAYWLAAGADAVWAAEDAELGSIGVVYAVEDSSAAAERYGVRVHLAGSTPTKGELFDGVPVTEEAMSRLGQQARAYHALFTAAVAQGRGVEPAKVEAWAAGELNPAGPGNPVYIGGHAVSAGLADTVGTLDQAVAEARQLADARASATTPPARAAARAAAQRKATAMTLDELKQQNPEEYEALMADAKARAMEEIEEEKEEEKPDEPAATAAAATFAELDAAIDASVPNRDAVIAEAQRRGLTVVSAQSLAMNRMAKALKASAAVRDVGGGATPAAGNPAAGGPATFPEAVDRLVSGGMSRGQATLEAARRHAKLHREWLVAEHDRAGSQTVPEFAR